MGKYINTIFADLKKYKIAAYILMAILCICSASNLVRLYPDLCDMITTWASLLFLLTTIIGTVCWYANNVISRANLMNNDGTPRANEED